MDIWKKKITNTAADFILDPEADSVKVEDGVRATIGGMIVSKTIKYTKNNKAMAFITVEDLYGTVEVIVFPKDYEKYSRDIIEDTKVFVTGRTSVEEDKDGKMILESLTLFSDITRELWIRFANKADYVEKEAKLKQLTGASDGKDVIVVYLAEEKAYKRLGPEMSVNADATLVEKLKEAFGSDNITLR